MLKKGIIYLKTREYKGEGKTLPYWTRTKIQGSGLKGKGTRKSGQTRIFRNNFQWENTGHNNLNTRVTYTTTAKSVRENVHKNYS